MDMESRTIYPFVPGRVRGVVQHGPEATRDDAILVVTQDQLNAVTGTPAALLLIDAAPFSHAVIRSLGLGIPVAMLGEERLTSLTDGSAIILDCVQGQITIPASAAPFTPWTPAMRDTCGEPFKTGDGIAVELCASINNLSSASRAVQNGATAIGLLRSECLLPPAGSTPDTGFFRYHLEQIMEAAKPLAITIRLLDFVPDKLQDWLPTTSGMDHMFGQRGTRLYEMTAVHDVLRAELQAIAALSSYDSLQVMLPSGSELEGFRQWREKLHTLLPAKVPIGVMIETPADALDIGNWLEESEFIGVGCNDMMQCLFGAERELPALRHLLDPYSPALFRFFRLMAERAGDQVHRLQLCGLLPQVQGVLPVLLGLGYRRFSGEPVLIPSLANSVTGKTINECQQIATEVCAARNSAQVRQILRVVPGPGWGLATG